MGSSRRVVSGNVDEILLSVRKNSFSKIACVSFADWASLKGFSAQQSGKQKDKDMNFKRLDTVRLAYDKALLFRSFDS